MPVSFLEFDSSIYSIKAIKRAISDLSNRAVCSINSENKGKVSVRIDPIKEGIQKDTDIEADFRRMVFDHQIYLEVEEDFKVIRQIIIAQAFFPCENLHEVTDKLSI